jgi:hypothetical protein
MRKGQPWGQQPEGAASCCLPFVGPATGEAHTKFLWHTRRVQIVLLFVEGEAQ